MAIVIIGIVVTLSIPEFNRAMQRQNLYNEAHQLAWDMRLARQEAITTGQATRVEFYQFTNCYEVNNKTRHYFPAGISYKSKPTFIHPKSHKIYCIFAASGAPSPAGSVCLTNANGDLKWVIVSLATGQVRMSNSPPKY